MALHTKTDFASLCGLQMKHFNTYVDRKKIVLTGEYVNDTDEVNALFIEKRKKKRKNLFPEVATGREIDKLANKEFVDHNSPKNNNEESEILNQKSDKSRENLTYVQLEKEKKLADLIKVEADTVYRQLQIDKLTGISIPTDLVKNVISTLSKSFVSYFKDGGESLIISISKKKGLTGKETADLRGELIKIINLSMSKSITQSRRDMKMITDSYSEKREVGEHD